ncbi:UNVERIFIED_CONTAM: hypothetical protein HDU68_012078, partial [Siphonaria sp. JEL0065]
MLLSLVVAAASVSAQCVIWQASPWTTPTYATDLGTTASQWDCNTKCQNGAKFNGGSYTHSSVVQYLNGTGLSCECLTMYPEMLADWIAHPIRPTSFCRPCLNSAGQDVFGALGMCGIRYDSSLDPTAHIPDIIDS